MTHKHSRASVPLSLTLILAAGVCALPMGVEANAAFDGRARLEITFTRASAGTSGTDYSVGANQPFTLTGYADGNASFATADDVSPGGVPGMDPGDTFYMELSGNGDAGLPFGGALAEVLGGFDIAINHYGPAFGPISFDFAWSISQAVTLTPGQPDEFAKAISLVEFGPQGGTALIDQSIDLDTLVGPLSDSLTGSDTFSVTLNFLESADYVGRVQFSGQAIAPYVAPVPATAALVLLGLTGLGCTARLRLSALLNPR